MEAWQWLALGLVLAGIELLTPGGFFVVFFGCAGLVVGLLTLGHVVESATWQWLLFSALSIVSLLLFRNPLLRAMRRHEPVHAPVDALVGETAFPVEPIAPGAVGRAELRGAAWSARNVGGSALTVGQRCRVTHVEGLQLGIQPEGRD
jgi:membrane protein implicated in regulation of membrane protease activity